MVLMALQQEPPSNNLEDGTEKGNFPEGNASLLVDLADGGQEHPLPLSSPVKSGLDSSLLEDLLLDESNEVFNGPPAPDILLPLPTSPSDHDCLQHPTYMSVLDRLDASRNTISSLQENMKKLEEKSSQYEEKMRKFDLLEQAVAQQEQELELSRQEHEIDLRTISSLKSEMEAKLSALKKQCDAANKEKESMVMRYAKNEKELLDQKKAREALDKRLKEVLKENEGNQVKLKALAAEKAKIAQTLDSKITEVANAYKEIDKLKDDINSRDIKIKWTQNKLKSEMDEHKDCSSIIEKLEQSVKMLEEELDSSKKGNLSLQRQLDGSEVNKNTEAQLKEQQAKLITEKHEKAELESKLKLLESKQTTLVEENETLSSQVLGLEQERLVMNKKLSALKEERSELSSRVAELENAVKEIEELRWQLHEQRERAGAAVEELERLQKSNEDLVADMKLCRIREAEMLAFTQKLTVKNVQLQSEFSAVEEKASELETEEKKLEITTASLQSEVEKLKQEIKEEQTKRHEEARLLARQVAEKTTKSLNLESLLTDTQSELNLLRQKHTTALKELQKELSMYRKRVDQLENGASSHSGSDSVNQGSRTSSLSSLNDNYNQSPYQVLDVPAHTLIERIVKLQNDCAKQTERIEFLEEHTGHLVRELQKKSKLLQNYIMREQTGALTSKMMDRNKAEQSKHGGIMASLYSSKPSESMTLELSMDINRKLQAVLEDTLLKNITLKENLDTLGDEIARLSQKNDNQ